MRAMAATSGQIAFQLLLWTVSISFITSEALDYSDLTTNGVSCYPRDTCNRPWIRFPNISCQCDNLCRSYDDCCIDPPSASRMTTKRLELLCLPYHLYKGVFAVGKCSSSWNGPRTIQIKCEKQDDDFSDPLLSIPATDTKTHITYRNRYCAECNNANPNILSTWSPTLTCDSLKSVDQEHKNITHDFIMQNIARVGHYWGVYHWNDSINGMSFYPCEVSFSLPEALDRSVRHCVPDAVSTCAPNWRREEIRQHCTSYMAVVYYGGQAYRNVHCAICNNVEVNRLQCLPPSPGILPRDRPPLSFTLLLDVNPNDGNVVGARNSCYPGQKYDPFFKKCRSIVCALPGYVVRNGRCVRK